MRPSRSPNRRCAEGDRRRQVIQGNRSMVRLEGVRRPLLGQCDPGFEVADPLGLVEQTERCTLTQLKDVVQELLKDEKRSAPPPKWNGS